MKKLAIAFLMSAAIIMAGTAASACAVLEKASPRVGSAVSGKLDTVNLRFSMQVFPSDSTLSVTNGQGQTVSTGKAFGDRADNTVLAVHVPDLAPGRYKVKWTVHAACGSYEPGDFKFTVNPPGTVMGL